MKKKLISLLALLLVGLAFVGCDDDDDNGTPAITNTVADLIIADADLTILESLLTNTEYNLAGVLSAAQASSSTLTVFAPTDAAFANLATALGLQLSDLTPAVVNQIVQYHILTQQLLAADLQAQSYATLLSGESVDITLAGGAKVDGANITTTDLKAVNGVVHKIDAVIVPSEPQLILGTVLQPAYFNRNFTTLVAAVKKAGLVTTLANNTAQFTVFAPTNQAFTNANIDVNALTAEQLTPVLTYHVLNSEVLSTALPTTGATATAITTLNGNFYLTNKGNGVFINGTTQVTTTDLNVANGVVHVIDGVLLPPTSTIVELAVAGYSELAAALTEAGLVDAINASADLTVFAPTNDAFAALYAYLGVSNATEIDDATLDAVLKHHVISAGRVFSSDLAAGSVTTLGGTSFSVAINGTTVTLEDSDPDLADATVTAVNVLATNGVVHQINGIILPVDTNPGTTGRMTTYPLGQFNGSGVSGTATFKELTNQTTLIEVALSGTPAGGDHPMHIHANTALQTGSIVIALTNVNGDTGNSMTYVSALNDGTAITYDELLDFNGYINVHLSPSNLSTVVSQGDIGQNAFTGNSVVYNLAEVGGSGVNGTATFAERNNGTTLVTLALTGTPTDGDHPAHIHNGSVSAPGGIAISLTNVNGNTGISRTQVSAKNDATAITYSELITYAGYINVHLSQSELSTVVANGNVGSSL